MSSSSILDTQSYSRSLVQLQEVQKPYLIAGLSPREKFNDRAAYQSFSLTSGEGKLKTSFHETLAPETGVYAGRWMSRQTYHKEFFLDEEEMTLTSLALDSQLVQDGVDALNRSRTKSIIRGFFAAVPTGQDMSGSAVYDTSNTIAFNYSGIFGQTATTFTIDKIMQLKTLVADKGLALSGSNQLGMNSLNMAIRVKDQIALLANKVGTDNYPMINNQYNSTVSAYTDAFTTAFNQNRDGMFVWNDITFHILPNDFFEPNGAGKIELPAWVKNGVQFMDHTPITGEVRKANTKLESTMLIAKTRFGVMRTDERKVFKIEVDA